MDNSTVMIVAGVVAVLNFGGWGCYVASCKNREWYEGFAAGAMLGPFGVLVMACMPTLEPKVPAPRSSSLRRSRDDHDDEQMERHREWKPFVDPPAEAPEQPRRYTDAEWAKRSPKDGRRPGPK